MKKWHSVLWVVFASLALSGLSLIFFRQKGGESVVARVNGMPILFNQYRFALLDIQDRINALKPLARLYGMSEETFVNVFFGASRPEDIAIDGCVREKLLDQAKEGLAIELDENWFKKELSALLPQLIDEAGNVNVAAYKQYLQHRSTKATEFENQKREEFKRQLVQQFVQLSAYVPSFIAKDKAQASLCDKSFVWTKIPLSYFVSQVMAKGIDEKELDAFYISKKENYRVSEKRSAVYWVIDPQKYAQAKGENVDEAMMKNFYEKHKSVLYRIAPKVKVRRIFIKGTLAQEQQKAHDVYKKVTAAPAQFATLAKQYSDDAKTSQNGGLVDFFSKGTYDQEFERAALRLRNDGELSPLTKVKGGYEIIQLVARINASEKPYAEVRDDIANKLKVKRSLGMLRSDLEALMRQARDDVKAVDAFITQYNLQTQKTAMLDQASSDTKGLDGALATRLFSKHKAHKAQGYFQNEDQYVLYKMDQVKPSYIAMLADIKETVRQDFIKMKADTLAQNAVKNVKAQILEKKKTLEDIAKDFGISISSLDHVKETKAPASLPFEAAIYPNLFHLVTPAMVLSHQDKDAYVIVQLKDMGTVDEKIAKDEIDKIIKQEKYKNSTTQIQAFIASLHRNAKIDIDKKFIAGQPVETKDE